MTYHQTGNLSEIVLIVSAGTIVLSDVVRIPIFDDRWTGDPILSVIKSVESGKTDGEVSLEPPAKHHLAVVVILGNHISVASHRIAVRC
jgi:hypothetical protein